LAGHWLVAWVARWPAKFGGKLERPPKKLTPYFRRLNDRVFQSRVLLALRILHISKGNLSANLRENPAFRFIFSISFGQTLGGRLIWKALQSFLSLPTLGPASQNTQKDLHLTCKVRLTCLRQHSNVDVPFARSSSNSKLLGQNPSTIYKKQEDGRQRQQRRSITCTCSSSSR
jgi:hypothetical protein